MSDGQFEFTFPMGRQIIRFILRRIHWNQRWTPVFINALEAGNYNFVLEDANGCLLAFSESISAPLKLRFLKTSLMYQPLVVMMVD